jgi:hypothetical protein
MHVANAVAATRPPSARGTRVLPGLVRSIDVIYIITKVLAIDRPASA